MKQADMFAAAKADVGPTVALHHGDCLDVMPTLPAGSVHAAILDPPFGEKEFDPAQITAIAGERRGVWRQPRRGRSPSPRYGQLVTFERQRQFFLTVARELFRISVPGAHVYVACTPAHQHVVTSAFVDAGWQMRTTLIRLVATLRGGDRPKNAHEEFANCTVLPRSRYEPWVLLRRPPIGTVAENLRIFGTGSLRRLSAALPFSDVVHSSRTSKLEKKGILHPTIKPVKFVSLLAESLLPGPGGTLIDCFSGSASTAIAALRTGRNVVCIEKDAAYFEVGRKRIADEQARLGFAVTV